MYNLVLSSLNKLSLIDIVTVFYARPDKAIYEISVLDDPQELPYYRQMLLEDQKLKKIRAVLSLEEQALEDFNDKKIKSYIFEELITYQFFRVENTLYSLEEGIPGFSTFFDDIQQLPTYSITLIDDLPETTAFKTDFVIFKPQQDKIDIIKFQKLFQQVIVET